MHPLLPNGFKLGILGSGQLARLLAIAAHGLGIETHVFTGNLKDPACLVNSHNHLIDLKTLNLTAAQIDLLNTLNAITFESEFVDTEMVSKIIKSKVYIAPSLNMMAQLQHRHFQKSTFIKYGLPTAEFFEVTSFEDFNNVYAKFPKGFVLKRSFGGYDGYGTYMIANRKAFQKALAEFEPSYFEENHFIAEKLIPFKRELAITFACDQFGQVIDLPLVETKQSQYRCDWVLGPIKHPGINLLKKKISAFLKKTKYVGVITFELFDTGNNLLINECAPRVHNSAHYTLDALNFSQFAYHIQCLAGLKIQKYKMNSKGFCMSNLIGKGGNISGAPGNLTGHLHWYGKSENRNGRKMGHVNYLGSSPSLLLKQALKERKLFKL